MLNELEALKTARDEALMNKLNAEVAYNYAIDNYNLRSSAARLDALRCLMNQAIASWYEACDACVALERRLNA